jgi:hypothetical protein
MLLARCADLCMLVFCCCSDLSHSHNISRDFSGHFLGQLSAAERRRAANRLGSLWHLVSNAERDKKAQLHRIQREIDEESFRRTVHMKLLEEQAMERALKATMVDKQQERGQSRGDRRCMRCLPVMSPLLTPAGVPFPVVIVWFRGSEVASRSSSSCGASSRVEAPVVGELHA